MRERITWYGYVAHNAAIFDAADMTVYAVLDWHSKASGWLVLVFTLFLWGVLCAGSLPTYHPPSSMHDRAFRASAAYARKPKFSSFRTP
jgi:hypothetical protein